MDESAGKSLGDYARLVRRRWPYPVILIPAALLVAIYIAYTTAPTYRASGTIMLEPSSIPEDMVPSTVTGLKDVPAYADQQLELVRRRVMTSDRLEQLIEKVDPYPQSGMGIMAKTQLVADSTQIERVDPITLEPLDQSLAFSIHYYHSDPEIAAAVAAEIVELFITYNQRTRVEQAEAAYDFLQKQAQGLEESMRTIEKQLAQFKSEYGDALPESQLRSFAAMERSRRELDEAEREIRTLEEQEALLKLQLSELSPSLTAAVSDWRLELAKLKSELAVAEQKYTSEHPDVKRLRRAIADLAALGASSTAGVAQRPDNPEYLRVQSQLGAARQSLQALRSRASRARSELSQYERSLVMSPNVEREYRQLSREYENAVARYQDVQNKLKDAALAQDLESEARGERFTLVRSPFKPGKPYSPNRLGIILLGFVLGAALAFGAAAAVEASDPTVRSSNDLEGLVDAASLIGAVPVMLNAEERRRRGWVWSSLVAVFVVATALVAVTVARAAEVMPHQTVSAAEFDHVN